MTRGGGRVPDPFSRGLVAPRRKSTDLHFEFDLMNMEESEFLELD